jgi:hypothetical protein
MQERQSTVSEAQVDLLLNHDLAALREQSDRELHVAFRPIRSARDSTDAERVTPIEPR